MMKKFELAREVYARFGMIRRARKCFLYTAKNVRLTDLYQEGGRAILGWGGSVFTILKNVLERGITGSYFTDFSMSGGGAANRLSKAVSALFADGRTAYMFPSKSLALQAALSVSPESTFVYRPWNPQTVDWNAVDCIVFAPPLPWADSMYILAVKNMLLDSENYCIESKAFFPAPLVAAVTRSIYDLIRALQEREEKHWFIYDTVLTKYWTRKGPYLFPKVPEERYADFVLHCLDCNLVISPYYNQPSIVPFGADKGNFSKLKNNPFPIDSSDCAEAKGSRAHDE